MRCEKGPLGLGHEGVWVAGQTATWEPACDEVLAADHGVKPCTPLCADP